MIKNLIFDFGKVLVDYDFEVFFRHHIPDDVRRHQFYLLLHDQLVQQQVDRELIPFDDLVSKLMADNPQFATELSVFRDRYTEIVTNEVPGMLALLSRYREQGFMLYGLTNWCSRVHQTMAQFPIFQLLHGWVISSEEHLIKPEPEIYQCLCSRYNLRPEECVFTDDRMENVEGARKVGMQAVLFQSAQQFDHELSSLLSKG